MSMSQEKLEIEELQPISKMDSRHTFVSSRSEITQEIIDRRPNFVEKWALSIFLGFLFLLFGLTWFIKYPDKINAIATLAGTNAPKEIVCNQSGRLIKLLVSNLDTVKQNQVLGWMESNADIQEIFYLSHKLDSAITLYNNNNLKASITLFKKQFLRLGELQSSYQSFLTATLISSDYLANGFYQSKADKLAVDIISLENMKKNALLQKTLNAQDNELSIKTFEMNEKLFNEKVISSEEYRRAKSQLINKLTTEPQLESNIISQQSLIRDKNKEIDQITHDIIQHREKYGEELKTLKNNVLNWLRIHTIVAPTDGTVVFAIPLQVSHHIDAGKVVGYVNPVDSKYYAEIKLMQTNLGKVDTGMRIQLRFEAYPYQEIGFLPGTLDYISNIALDSVFLGTARFDNGLITNQNKLIHYKPGLKAQAIIITKEMRLLEKIYYSIVKDISINK